MSDLSISFDGRGGEGRRIVLTWLQKQKRDFELPECSRKYDLLGCDLRNAIANAAGVPFGVPLADLMPHQRWALRRSCDSLERRLEEKLALVRKAKWLAAKSCTDDEPVKVSGDIRG